MILYDIRGCCYLLLYLVGKHTEHAAILGTLLIDYMFGYVFVSTNFVNMLRGPCRENSRSQRWGAMHICVASTTGVSCNKCEADFQLVEWTSLNA